MRVPRVTLIVCALCAVACGKSTEGKEESPKTTATATGTTGGGSSGSSGGTGGTSGTNAIHGTVNGNAFNTVASALWLGRPDDASTTVVYLYDQAVQCGWIADAGWDRTIPDGTNVLEFKVGGRAPGSYPITRNPTHIPSPGESASNYTRSHQTTVPTEQVADGGHVDLTFLTPSPQAGDVATGAFDLVYGGTDSLSGTFRASYCPVGVEP